MRIRLILKEEMIRQEPITSRLQKLDNWNMSRNTVRFADLFKELFKPEEYKFIPNAIKKLGNPAIAGQILFYVGRTLGKKMCVTLYNIASENPGMKQLLDKRGLDRAIYDDNWYQQNNYLTELSRDEERLKMLADSGDEEAIKELEKLKSRKEPVDLESISKKIKYYIDKDTNFAYILSSFKDVLPLFPQIIEKIGMGGSHTSWLAMRFLKTAKAHKIMASNENNKPSIVFDPETEKKLLEIVRRNYRNYEY